MSSVCDDKSDCAFSPASDDRNGLLSRSVSLVQQHKTSSLLFLSFFSPPIRQLDYFFKLLFQTQSIGRNQADIEGKKNRESSTYRK